MLSNLADHVYAPLNSGSPLTMRNVEVAGVEPPSPWDTQDRELPSLFMTVATDCVVYGRTSTSGNDVESNVITGECSHTIRRTLKNVVSDLSVSVDIDGIDSDMGDLGPVRIPREDRSFIRIHNYRRNISCTLLVVSREPHRVIGSLEFIFRALPLTVHKWCKVKGRNSDVFNTMMKYV